MLQIAAAGNPFASLLSNPSGARRDGINYKRLFFLSLAGVIIA
jgi:hypothetical protein